MGRVCPECGTEYDDNVKRCPKDGLRTMLVEAADDLIGQTIDERFTVNSLLGKGGMGAVYRAFQHSMDREVALKVMRRDLASNTEAVKRFFREARAASKLHNPHTITVFDFGQTDDGLLYIVMELLQGRPMSRVLKDSPGPMDPTRALDIVNQVLTALADAHAIGILHRDLKPDNIFLVEGEATRDFVKVLDFGIAKILGSEGTSLTGTGALFGTPTYMSPEQAKGMEADARSDLYAVGVILFELLAGKPPFMDKTPMALLLKKTQETAPTIFHVNPDVNIPRGLDAVVSRVLSSRPEDRPSDAAEMIAMLTRAIASGTEPGVPMPDVVVRHGTTELAPKTTEEIVDPGPTAEGDIVEDSAVIPPDRKTGLGKWLMLAAGVAAVAVLGALYATTGGDDPAQPVRPAAVVPMATIDAGIAPDEGAPLPDIGSDADHGLSDLVKEKDVGPADTAVSDPGMPEKTVEKRPVKKTRQKNRVKKRTGMRKTTRTHHKGSVKDRKILDMLRRD